MERKLKILGICTSNRGTDSNTYFLLKLAFDRLTDADVEKEIIVASELNVHRCNHYYSENARMCVYPCNITRHDSEDEMKKIYDAILAADVVVFSTPIYWGNHSSLMQNLIERLNSMENANSVHKQILIKNKIGAIMVLGHEDGYQHVVGGLMAFMTALGLIFPPHAYAAWVGESTENTSMDRTRIRTDLTLQQGFIDVVRNAVDFARAILVCRKCGEPLDYEHLSEKKRFSRK
jgi:multimeric flavodoxin WrbA